ncbi:hypothetical protein SKAU_G00019660, partial [Synaphobranchus kaupii]
MTKPKLDACEQRWVAKLAPCSFDLKHIAGSKNIVADALSRDPFARVTKDLQSKHKRYQYVLPKSLKEKALSGIHDLAGQARTLHLARQRFFWPKMEQDVKEYVKCCRRCVVAKTPEPSARAPLESITTSAPMELGALDENAYAVELGFDGPPERSTNLEMLSEELERQTIETQKLQEQVEHATKRTMERMGRTLGGATSHVPKNIKVNSIGIPTEVNVPEVHISGQDLRIQPDMYDHNLDVQKHNLKHSGKDVVDRYSQQVSELQQQLSATHGLHEQQNLHLRQCIMKLQTKLQDSQMETDALLDQRVKECQRQADLVGKLQGTIRELQGSKQVGDHMLLEAENQVELLCKKQVALDQTLQEVGSALLDYEKRSAMSAYMDQVSASPGNYSLGMAVGRVLQDLDMENANLKEKLLLVEEQLGALKLEFQEKNVLMIKEQTERKQAERLASMYHSQKTELESSVSILHSKLLDAQKTHREKV